MNKTEPFGIVHDLHFEDYRQLSGINQSTLKQWIPASSIKPMNQNNSQAMKFGTAGHCLLLEPELFLKKYINAPAGINKRGKVGKERWSKYAQKYPNKILLQTSEWKRLEKIRKFFEVHPEVQKIWKNGDSEVSLFWKDSDYHIKCKARLDWLNIDSGTIIDLKFTNNISRAFSMESLGDYYTLQACWYIRAVTQLTSKVPDFFFVFIEKYAPHDMTVRSISRSDIEKGKQIIEHVIKKSQIGVVNE